MDDEAGVLHSTAALVRELGHQAVALRRHEDVCETIRRERPDVLLQDVRMPGLDLRALVERLRTDRDVPAVPIVLFSADLELEAVQREVRADAVLEKPFRLDELERVLGQVGPPPAWGARDVPASVP